MSVYMSGDEIRNILTEASTNPKNFELNCLAVKLKSASNQEIVIAFVYNLNDESDKISNLRKGLDHMADNGTKNQMIIGCV